MRASGRTRTTIGRGVELDAIKELLVGLDEGPRGLFLVGPPGIGKTQLWLDGVEFARARGVRVSTTRPAEADAHVAFAALRDLIGDAAEEVLAELPEPQRRALAVTLLLEEPGAKAPEPDAISAAFFRALRLLARPQPLLFAVDDAQWLDASSRAVLAFALRRLEDDRVGVLATVRVQGGVDVDDLLVALPSELTERRDLAPLTVAALYELVRERLWAFARAADAPAPPRTRRREPVLRPRARTRRPVGERPADGATRAVGAAPSAASSSVGADAGRAALRGGTRPADPRSARAGRRGRRCGACGSGRG